MIKQIKRHTKVAFFRSQRQKFKSEIKINRVSARRTATDQKKHINLENQKDKKFDRKRDLKFLTRKRNNGIRGSLHSF